MKKWFLVTATCISCMIFASQSILAQSYRFSERMEFDMGLGYPDLLHLGMKYQLSKLSNIGMSYGSLIPTRNGNRHTQALTLEHEFHFGKQVSRKRMPPFYFSQKVTYIMDATELVNSNVLYFTPSIGKSFYSDGPFGLNIDAGLNFKLANRYQMILPGDEREYKTFATVFPAVRLQFFFKI
jgi:hypothetical protein